MVTVQELEDLKRSEEEALARQTPVRRFGSGRDIAFEQRQLRQRRQQAQENIQRIEETKQRVQEENIRQNETREQQDRVDRIQNAIRQGTTAGLNREERQLVGNILASRGSYAGERASSISLDTPVASSASGGVITYGQALERSPAVYNSIPVASSSSGGTITYQQATQINPSSNLNYPIDKPVGVVKSAENQRKQFLSNQPFITGELTYYTEKFRGSAGKRFERIGGGQNPAVGKTGERLSLIAQTSVRGFGVYTSRGLSEVFISGVNVGTALLGSKRSQRAYTLQAQELSRVTNLPLSASLGVVGGIDLLTLGQGKKAFSLAENFVFSNIKTQVTSTTRLTSQVGDLKIYETDYLAVSSRKGLFTNKVYYSFGKSETSVEQGKGLFKQTDIDGISMAKIDKKAFSYKDVTRGFTINKKDVGRESFNLRYNPIIDKFEGKRNVNSFASKSIGEGRTKKLTQEITSFEVEIDLKDLKLTTPFSIQKQKSITFITSKGRFVSEKGINLINNKASPVFSEGKDFIGVGASTEVFKGVTLSKQQTLEFRKNLFDKFKFSKRDKQTSKGLNVLEKQQEQNTEYFSTFGRTSQQRKTISPDITSLANQKITESVNLNIQEISKPAKISKSLLVAKEISRVNSLPSYVGGGGRTSQERISITSSSNGELSSSKLNLQMKDAPSRLSINEIQTLGVGLSSITSFSDAQTPKQFSGQSLNFKQELEQPAQLQKRGLQEFQISTQGQQERLKQLSASSLINKKSSRSKLDINLKINKIPIKQKISFVPVGFSRNSNIPIDSGKGGVEVLLRRYGKFITIGKGLSPLRASTLARSRADKTLGRTIQFKGSPSELRKINVDKNLFRQPKLKSSLNKPFTFIEKSKFALSRSGEIIEIQRSRRR